MKTLFPYGILNINYLIAAINFMKHELKFDIEYVAIIGKGIDVTVKEPSHLFHVGLYYGYFEKGLTSELKK